MKVVINIGYGGFSISEEAFEHLNLKRIGGFQNEYILGKLVSANTRF